MVNLDKIINFKWDLSKALVLNPAAWHYLALLYKLHNNLIIRILGFKDLVVGVVLSKETLSDKTRTGENEIRYLLTARNIEVPLSRDLRDEKAN